KGGGGQRRYLGIILNRKLESAPGIREKITSRGIINGDFTVAQTQALAAILNAGSLPAALNVEPISEESISPTLGAETVQQGKVAMVLSVSLVLLFMLLYYRFSGFVACLALMTNLVLTLGLMVLIQAHLTLPGLAGLVLTVGMSVDANVLIFERMREEQARGAALRMVIRNGFGRATSAIVDSNITTIITGIILFWIGTDQIKGFAVTLILGILSCMYTAIFCSRIIFDIAERHRWLTSVKMFQFVGKTQIDFVGKAIIASTFSCLIIVVGLIAIFTRGTGLMNIDFTGGVSVTMVLNEETSQKEIYERLAKTDLRNRNLLVVEQGTDQRNYTINARYEEAEDDTGSSTGQQSSVKKVEEILQDVFGKELSTYHLEITPLEEIAADATQKNNTESSAADTGQKQTVQNRENIFAGGTRTKLIFGDKNNDQDEGVAFDTVSHWIEGLLASRKDDQIAFKLSFPGYIRGSAERSEEWELQIALPPVQVQSLMDQLQQDINLIPRFPLSNRIGGHVAVQLQQLAIMAILLSLICIVGYMWIRFERVFYGLAAAVALVHDVLTTVGMIAISAYIVQYASPLADLLQIEPFQISLTILAALLTIIGYSLNDTIVIFDRIREIRGKSPYVTADIINTSLNQTLSRTLLTAGTSLISVMVLYFAGGAGIHGFAFALVIGVITGTWSTVFIGAPLLLIWAGGPRGKTNGV
ncbi:MAG: protein translocase subunit SecD, partial [Pirellulales bacterium]|nr:protein translocase subunit SecD [Pirellulales bacterium]